MCPVMILTLFTDLQIVFPQCRTVSVKPFGSQKMGLSMDNDDVAVAPTIPEIGLWESIGLIMRSDPNLAQTGDWESGNGIRFHGFHSNSANSGIGDSIENADSQPICLSKHDPTNALPGYD
jgi:hypothetical protein